MSVMKIICNKNLQLFNINNNYIQITNICKINVSINVCLQ
jgi:hypothetical protein